MFGGSYFAGGLFGATMLVAGLPAPPNTATISGITIDGVDVKPRVRRHSLQIVDILNDAPNTCRFVMDGPDVPQVGQSLRVTLDFGQHVLFAGRLQAVDSTFTGTPDFQTWQIQAIDDTAQANAKRPFGTFVDVSATTIANTIRAQCIPAFSGAGIAAGLPAVSIVFDGADTFIHALERLATLIGGYCKVEDQVVYLFQVDVTVPPDPIDEAHRRFLYDPHIQANVDGSQLRTRVYGKGYGEQIRADLAAGETLIPVTLGAQFPPGGGTVIAGTTPAGAQSERFSYTAVELSTLGTLVGPGAAPTTAPTLGLAAGAGVTSGLHDVSVVFVTAAGKSLAGPVASITAGTVTAPGAAPTAATAINGAGPDQGSHDYQVSFVLPFGETLPGPVSNAITTSAAVGVLTPPGAPALADGATTGSVEIGLHRYGVTFVNANGETNVGNTQDITTQLYGTAGTVGNIQGPTSGTTGGGLTPGKHYYYIAVYFSATGESAGSLGPFDADALLTADENAVSIQGIPIPVGFPAGMIVGRYIYRHEDTGSGFDGVYFRVGTINNVLATTFVDTMSQAQAETGPARSHFDLNTVSTVAAHTVQVSNIATGPAGTTGRRLYRSVVGASGDLKLVTTLGNNTATTFEDTRADATLGAAAPVSNTTGTAVQVIPVSNIPLGPGGTTSRKLFRRFNGAGTFKRVTTIANNTATTFNDIVANSALGETPLGSPTAVGNQITVSSLPKGGSATTARELYMSLAGGGTRRLALAVANNTDTTATITIDDGALAGGALEPAADTSGLQQPQGQVNAGSTILPVASAARFRAGGGWVTLANAQTVRYSAVSGQTLTGIPPSGSGAITTTVLYGDPAIPAPMLTGASGLSVALQKGSSVHIWVRRDDLQAQADHAARTGGDGIVEYLVVDTRRGVASLTERCDAELAMFAQPILTVGYATRDLKTKSGKEVPVNLTSPRVSGVVTIQQVTITEIDIVPGLAPRFAVTASSVRFSLEDTLRRLVAGGLVAGGSS